MGMGVARQQVGCAGEADGDASITGIWYILENKRPHRLVPILYVCSQRRAALWQCAFLNRKIIFRQLLDQLGMVQDDGGSLLCLFLGDCLGTSTAAQVGARLLRLAQWLVDDVPLVDALGLHSSNASEYVQDLLIAGKSDLAIEVELVHGGKVGAAVGRASINMQFPMVRMRRKAVGSIRAGGRVRRFDWWGGKHLQRTEKTTVGWPARLQEAMTEMRKNDSHHCVPPAARRCHVCPPIACWAGCELQRAPGFVLLAYCSFDRGQTRPPPAKPTLC